ncbi:MAG: ankyrin repeat domain-containing protein [Gemmatimonadaceae bacterium]|nr:ankyrin repeat domain-containing protein [Gemmatimonadaceae bacterium]
MHAVNLIAQHRARSIAAGRILAAYVPRFYGETVESVLASDPTEEEARHAVARLHGAPSWEMLVERLARESRSVVPDGPTGPMMQAASAMEAGDLGALETIVAEHPALLEPAVNDLATGHTLTLVALGIERRRGVAAMQPVFDWLATRGLDRRSELGRRLCGHMRMRPDEVQSLLEQGADPNWVAPNGIPVLEHALIRYWNGEAVDVLARHATARDALWVAAGLGDLSGVRRFLSRDGRPTPAAREHRPDFIAVGQQGGPPPLPDPDDDEILLEAMLVAMLNGRTAVLEYLSSSSAAQINSVAYGTPLINLAVANRMAPVVECLVRVGANLDLFGQHTGATARELARDLLKQSPDDNASRRIALACGIDVGESSRGDKG